MVQDGHEVRVGFAVSQPLPGQLKHLSRTFCVYVNLVYRKNKSELDINFLIPLTQEECTPCRYKWFCSLGSNNRALTLLASCTGPHQHRAYISGGKPYDLMRGIRIIIRIHTSSNLLANSSSSSFRSISKKSKCLKGNWTKISKSRTSHEHKHKGLSMFKYRPRHTVVVYSCNTITPG